MQRAKHSQPPGFPPSGNPRAIVLPGGYPLTPGDTGDDHPGEGTGLLWHPAGEDGDAAKRAMGCSGQASTTHNCQAQQNRRRHAEKPGSAPRRGAGVPRARGGRSWSLHVSKLKQKERKTSESCSWPRELQSGRREAGAANVTDSPGPDARESSAIGLAPLIFPDCLVPFILPERRSSGPAAEDSQLRLASRDAREINQRWATDQGEGGRGRGQNQSVWT